MDDFEFIIKYRNMKKISHVCRNNKIDASNLSKGKTSKENVKKVADELRKEIIELYSYIIKGMVL